MEIRLDKIIIGYKAVCQEQKHWGGKKILLVIIVGTIALKACTSIIAFMKVAPMWFTRLFYNYWILLSSVFRLFVTKWIYTNQTPQGHTTAIHWAHLKWKWAFLDCICILAHSQALRNDINNAERAELLLCWTDAIRNTKYRPCNVTRAEENGFLFSWKQRLRNQTCGF